MGENLYVVTYQSKARLYQVVTCETDSYLQFRLLDLQKNNVTHKVFRNLTEIEEMFNDYKKIGVIDDWMRVDGSMYSF